MAIQETVNKIKARVLRYKLDWRISSLSRDVARYSKPLLDQKPIAFFNASSRLGGMSLNAAFTQLTSWGLQLEGVPVVHFACKSGMSRCVLGTNPDDHTASPPCEACIAQSKKLLASTPTHWFEYESNSSLANDLEPLDLEELSNFQFQIPNSQFIIPLGKLVLPSLRWALRKHHLADDEATRHQLREYILSAYRVAEAFDAFLTEERPSVVVLFNGLQFPEATARWVARQYGICTIIHEVSFQPFSAFFTEEDATAYPIDIPDDFELSLSQNARLDAYLSQRFKGEFTMAGIRFWPEMSGLDDEFLDFVGRIGNIL